MYTRIIKRVSIPEHGELWEEIEGSLLGKVRVKEREGLKSRNFMSFKTLLS